jgi:hypothetical protein
MKTYICEFEEGYTCEVLQPDEEHWKTVHPKYLRKLKCKPVPIPKRFHRAYRLWLRSVMEQMEDDWGINRGESKKLVLPMRFYRRRPQQLEMSL